jgi:hypothetical protein
VAKFAEKYNLEPVSWTYFQAEFDNYVIELNSALAGESSN